MPKKRWECATPVWREIYPRGHFPDPVFKEYIRPKRSVKKYVKQKISYFFIPGELAQIISDYCQTNYCIIDPTGKHCPNYLNPNACADQYRENCLWNPPMGYVMSSPMEHLWTIPVRRIVRIYVQSYAIYFNIHSAGREA